MKKFGITYQPSTAFLTSINPTSSYYKFPIFTKFLTVKETSKVKVFQACVGDRSLQSHSWGGGEHNTGTTSSSKPLKSSSARIKGEIIGPLLKNKKKP